ncbi:MAG: prepilin peptidase [Patescibacteria group bacterium]
MLTLFFSIVFILGLITGSFLNCLIWRLYRRESLRGRSYCPHCRRAIAWYDNIPVLSFFILRGRCRSCRQNISWQYPLVELATAILFVLTCRLELANPQLALALSRDWLLVIALLVVFVYDLRWQLIPLDFLAPAGVAVFLLNLLLGAPLLLLLTCAALGAAFFLVQYILTGRRGVGEGDIWLGAFLGLAFPAISRLFLIMVASYTLGASISLILLVSRRKQWQSRIALGPFLAAGAIITLIWGEAIIAWYWRLLS